MQMKMSHASVKDDQLDAFRMGQMGHSHLYNVLIARLSYLITGGTLSLGWSYMWFSCCRPFVDRIETSRLIISIEFNKPA